MPVVCDDLEAFRLAIGTERCRQFVAGQRFYLTKQRHHLVGVSGPEVREQLGDSLACRRCGACRCPPRTITESRMPEQMVVVRVGAESGRHADAAFLEFVGDRLKLVRQPGWIDEHAAAGEGNEGGCGRHLAAGADEDLVCDTNEPHLPTVAEGGAVSTL